MWPWRTKARGFTLLEVLVALTILAILVSGLAMPLATQVQLRRQEETRRILEEAKETLLGFAAAQARLPCPATIASRGQESFSPTGDAANGECSNFHDGYLPAAALGLSPLDGRGSSIAFGPRDTRTKAARRVSWLAAAPQPDAVTPIPDAQMKR